MAEETVVLEQLVQACKLTYAAGYPAQLATVTLPIAARALSISFPALMTSFGRGLNLHVIAVEFKLNRAQVKKLNETLELMTVNEVLALSLALGPTNFVASPLAIVVDLAAAGNLLEFYMYLVLNQGKMRGLIGLGRGVVPTEQA